MVSDPVNLTAAQKRLALTGLLVVFLLGAMDNVIVSTALPRIMEQLHGIELYAWVSTIYMLTSTVMVPIYGKLGDMYGRKLILVIAVTIFLFGSALCGLAGEFGDLPIIGGGMAQLVVFRAIQGIGGGGLFSSAFAIIAELFSLRERGKYMGLLGGMFALASIIGPAIGGFFTDFATTTLFGYEIAGWRWVFYVNLPLGFVSLLLIISRMPRLRRQVIGTVDYLGALLVITTFVPMLLAFTWAGREYPWDSLRIIALLSVAGLSLLLFIGVEARTKDAILPLELFRVRAFSLTNLAGFVVSMAFFGIIMFMPLFLQAVQGVNATRSGFTMLAFMVGLLIGATGSGNLASRLGRYKLLMVSGGLLLFLGVCLLQGIGPDTTSFGVEWRLFMVGLGLGPIQSLSTLVVQNAVGREHLGIATSSSQFFRQLGSTIGIAIYGTLLTHNLNDELAMRVPHIEGVTAEKINLSDAQAQVMNPHKIAAQIESAFDDKLTMVTQAYRGDTQALSSVLDDPWMPLEIKSDVRNLPTPPFTQAVLQQQTDIARKQLAVARMQLTQRVEDGTRLSFSNAITSLFAISRWIVALGFLLILAIPELPLLDRHGKQPVVEGG